MAIATRSTVLLFDWRRNPNVTLSPSASAGARSSTKSRTTTSRLGGNVVSTTPSRRRVEPPPPQPPPTPRLLLLGSQSPTNFRVREVRGSRPTLTVICGWSSLGIDRGCVRSHRAEQFGASTRLILASGAPRDTAGAAGATRAAGAVGAAGTPDHIDGRVDSLGESKRSGDALSVEDPTRSLTSTADSTTASSGASILVQGLEGRSWAEKAQHARKLLAGLLALSRPHNFLPSVLLVLLGAFLGASSAGSGTAAMTAATANISATAAAAAKTAAATAATAATATAAASLPALPVWLSPRVLLVAALSGSIALASMVVNDVFDWQIGSDRVNSPAKPLVSGAVHPYDAELAAGCLYSLIVLAACQLEPLPLRMLVAGAAVGTYLYTPFLKRITLVKNVSVAAIIASSLLAGALAAGASFSALYRASGAFLFLFHALLYREVLMDVADVTGDASAGVPTLAVRLGKQRAVMVACGMLVLAHAAGAFLARRSPALVLLASICLLPLYAHTIPLLSLHSHTRDSLLSPLAHGEPHAPTSPSSSTYLRNDIQDRHSKENSILLTEVDHSSGFEVRASVLESAQVGGMEASERMKESEDIEQKKLSRLIDMSMVFIGAALLAFSAATVGFGTILA